ncbi:MAG TPA: hypothetical protein VK095_10230 [Beutenbergiaceae bacterium]|nr:hypothetical protein [Beutenbergiaceae bacterium]
MVLSRGALLLARAVLVTACVFSLALAAHVWGGGGLPDPLLAVTAASLLLLVTSILARIQLRAPALLVLLAAAQFGLHHVFAVPPAGSCAGHGDYHVAGQVFAAPTEPSGCAMGHHHDFGWQMFAAHAIATIVTTVLVAGAERALWAVVSWLHPLLAIFAVPQVPTIRCTCALAAYHRRLPARMVLDPTTPLRAPPVVALAA